MAVSWGLADQVSRQASTFLREAELANERLSAAVRTIVFLSLLALISLARPAGGPLFPRLLRLLVLPAALRVLRPASPGGEAPAFEHPTPPPGRRTRWRASSPTSAGAGRRRGSCSAPIAALRGRS